MQQSIENAKISGGDRPVVWDGQTKGGVDLSNQLKAIEDSRSGLAKRKDPEQPPAIMLGPKPSLPQIRLPQQLQPMRPPMGTLLRTSLLSCLILKGAPGWTWGKEGRGEILA